MSNTKRQHYPPPTEHPFTFYNPIITTVKSKKVQIVLHEAYMHENEQLPDHAPNTRLRKKPNSKKKAVSEYQQYTALCAGLLDIERMLDAWKGQELSPETKALLDGMRDRIEASICGLVARNRTFIEDPIILAYYRASAVWFHDQFFQRLGRALMIKTAPHALSRSDIAEQCKAWLEAGYTVDDYILYRNHSPEMLNKKRVTRGGVLKLLERHMKVNRGDIKRLLTCTDGEARARAEEWRKDVEVKVRIAKKLTEYQRSRGSLIKTEEAQGQEGSRG